MSNIMAVQHQLKDGLIDHIIALNDKSKVVYDDEKSLSTIYSGTDVVAEFDDRNLVYHTNNLFNVVYNFKTRNFKLVLKIRNYNSIGRYNFVDFINYNGVENAIVDIVPDGPFLNTDKYINSVVHDVMTLIPGKWLFDLDDVIGEFERLVDVSANIKNKELERKQLESSGSFCIIKSTYKFIQMNTRSTIDIQRVSDSGWVVHYVPVDSSSNIIRKDGDEEVIQHHQEKVKEYIAYLELHGCVVRKLLLPTGYFLLIDTFGSVNTDYIDRKYDMDRTIYANLAKYP